VWNQTFELHIESLDDKLKIICYDEDALTNDLVGEAILSLRLLCKELNDWIPLKYQGKKSAEIHISTKYKPPMEEWPNDIKLPQENSHPNVIASSILNMIKKN
jgi:Ca2+-dependent lipid-binding protein